MLPGMHACALVISSGSVSCESVGALVLLLLMSSVWSHYSKRHRLALQDAQRQIRQLPVCIKSHAGLLWLSLTHFPDVCTEKCSGSNW